jgi:hypothetical protein
MFVEQLRKELIQAMRKNARHTVQMDDDMTEDEDDQD